MQAPLRTFVFMTAFFAAGAGVILFARGPQGWPAIQERFQRLRQAQIDVSKTREAVREMEEDLKRLRNPASEENDLLIQEQLQRQKQGDLRLKPADPPAGLERK
jgi:hypothetical protein